MRTVDSLELALLLVALGFCTVCKSKDTGPSSTAACASLSRLECYASSHCFLDHLGPSRYECRDKRGPCETGFRQTDRAACEARPECEWKPGNCYCPFPGYGETAVKDPGPSGGACACGGGPPAMCVERSRNPGDAGAR